MESNAIENNYVVYLQCFVPAGQVYVADLHRTYRRKVWAVDEETAKLIVLGEAKLDVCGGQIVDITATLLEEPH